MKKFIFTYLLAAFFVSPFINVMENAHHSEDKGSFCQTHKDMETHEQTSNPCHVCHLNIDFPGIQKFSFLTDGKDENILKLKDDFAFPDTLNSLHKPPIV